MSSDADERSEDGFSVSSYTSPPKSRTTSKLHRPSPKASPQQPSPSPNRPSSRNQIVALRTSPIRSSPLPPSSSPSLTRSVAASSSFSSASSSSSTASVAHPPLSQREMDELRAAFSVFDRHHSGSVSTSFLLSCLASLGYASSHQLVYSLLSAIPLTSLTFDDFLSLMTARVGEGSSREEVNRVFALFDEGGKGWLEEADLDRITQLVGQRLSHRERKELMQRADTDGDGVVSQEEFFNLMTAPSL